MSTSGADDERWRAPSPRLPGQAPEPVDAPRVVNISCALWAVAAVLLVLGFGLTLLDKDAVVAELVASAESEQVTASAISEGTETALWVLFVGAIAYAGLIGLFAYKAREGTRSARTVLTVLAGLLVATQFVLFPNWVTVLSAVVAAAALLLMYLPSVAEHYPKVPKSL